MRHLNFELTLNINRLESAKLRDPLINEKGCRETRHPLNYINWPTWLNHIQAAAFLFYF